MNGRRRGATGSSHQYGAEAFGFAGPDVDAELIVMCARLWPELGLKGIRLELNCIGSAEERARHRADLVKHLESHQARLDADAKRRMHSNPLRVLDSKNPAVQEVGGQRAAACWLPGRGLARAFRRPEETSGRGAGRIRDQSAAGARPGLLQPHGVRSGSPMRSAPRARSAAAGRHDGLFAQLGGKPAPGVGFAMGCERLVALMRDSGRRACGAQAGGLHGVPGRGHARARVRARRTNCAARGHAVVMNAAAAASSRR
jgi:histidyl-tRNA synthetase